MDRVTTKRIVRHPGLVLACAVTAAFIGLRSIAADDSTPALAPPAVAPESAPPPPPTEEVNKAPETPEPTSETPAATEVKPETPPPASPPAEAAQPPAPTPAEVVPPDTTFAARRQKWVPFYQTTRPAWAFEFTLSAYALGQQDIEGSQAGSITRAFETQVEYQFPFLQSIGVLSVGPSLVIYPVTPLGTVTSNAFAIWSGGGQVRYQARFFREQPIVPMAGFEYQYLTYHFMSDGSMGATGVSGPFFGAMILLNFFEPSAASELFIEQGISRSYLLAEYKQMSGGDGTISVSGGSYFFGLRLEF